MSIELGLDRLQWFELASPADCLMCSFRQQYSGHGEHLEERQFASVLLRGGEQRSLFGYCTRALPSKYAR